MEPFKNLINKGTFEAIGAQLQRAWPAFERKRFQKLAQTGLDALEFKAGARHVSAALEATLPEDFDQSAALLEATLAPTGALNEPRWAQVGNGALAGWAVWPMGEYVSRRGLQSPQRALATLHALTLRHHRRLADPRVYRAAPRTHGQDSGVVGQRTARQLCGACSNCRTGAGRDISRAPGAWQLSALMCRCT